MKFKIKPIFSVQKPIEKEDLNQKIIPDFIKVDIVMPFGKAVITSVPTTMKMSLVLASVGINPEEYDIIVNQSNMRLLSYDEPLSFFCRPDDKQINIIVSEKEEVFEEECGCEDIDDLCEDIDDLIEENSLLVLENESLKDEIRSLRTELERVTRLKDALLQATAEASAVLTAPFAEFFIDKGELK